MVGDDGGHSSRLGVDLRRAEPSLDAVDAADVRARAEQALFGAAAPACLGRFVLLGPIASGGMGTVYGAYDPQLDRRVALKLLRAERRGDPGERARLAAEARALARVDHPNVVPVHDVLEVDDQIVMVMELVTGETLAAWQATPRPWPVLVDAYAQLARGLAAIHALGLIHRDVKPHNALIGDDGRVRVLDFGLAAAADADATPAGTPGYLAPEVAAGGAATPAADQYGFAVSLGRALGGATTPRWLRVAVERGQATDPAARFPSMAAFLAELLRLRGWRRWRWPAALAAVVVAATLALLLGRRAPRDPLAACDGGAAELAGAWDVPQRAAVAAHLGGLPAPGPAIADRAVTALDRYRASWSAIHRRACVEHRRGALTDALHDRAAVCLQRRLAALSAAARVLATEAATAATALEVVAVLPPLADCVDREALAGDAELPPDDATRAAVAAIRARLAEAESVEHVGASAEALALTAPLTAQAEALHYPPVLVEVLLALGRMHLQRYELAAAAPLLRRAEELAFAADLPALAIEAGARRIFVEARAGMSADSAAIHGEALELVSRGLRADRFARPLLLNNLGTIEMSRSHPQAALRWFATGAALVSSLADPDVELSALDHNLAMLTEDAPARERLAEASWRQRAAALGPAHLLTLEAEGALGFYIADPARAQRHLIAASLGYAQHHPGLTWLRRYHEMRSGFVAFELEQYAVAADHFATARALAEAPSEWREAALADGWAALARQAPATAQSAFARALATPLPDDALAIADARLGVGLAAAARQDDATAVAQLTVALTFYAVVTQLSADCDWREHLALGRLTLAVVAARHGDRDRSRHLASLARRYYAAASATTFARQVALATRLSSR